MLVRVASDGRSHAYSLNRHLIFRLIADTLKLGLATVVDSFPCLGSTGNIIELYVYDAKAIY